jgi:hypothetical protein
MWRDGLRAAKGFDGACAAAAAMCRPHPVLARRSYLVQRDQATRGDQRI